MPAGQPHWEWKGIRVPQWLHPWDGLTQTRLSQQSIKIIGQAMHIVGSPAGCRKERAEWCCGMCLHRIPCLDQQQTIKATEWATNMYQAVVLESRVESTELYRTSLQGCPTWPHRTGKPWPNNSFCTGHTLGTDMPTLTPRNLTKPLVYSLHRGHFYPRPLFQDWGR